MSLPKLSQSYWLQTTTIPSFPPLTKPIKTDVAIIGGGITGITTAYLLAKQGVRVAVIEANRLCHGTTGHTTAKITAQHDLIYHELISHVGEENARKYYEANEKKIKEKVEKLLAKEIQKQLESVVKNYKHMRWIRSVLSYTHALQ